MTDAKIADINEFLAALFVGEIPLSPAHVAEEEDPLSAIRDRIGWNASLPEVPASLSQWVLQTDPEQVLQQLQEKWVAEYDRYLASLIEGGPEVWVETEQFPNEPVNEDELYALIDAHDHGETLCEAVISGNLARLEQAFADDPADFSVWFADLMEAAVGADQVDSLRCLLRLARTSRREVDISLPDHLSSALTLAAMHHHEGILELLLIEEKLDPSRFDTAFWRYHFPNGPAGLVLQECLIDRVTGYGSALLLRAVNAEDWERVRAIADRLNSLERAEQARETQQALAFLDRIGHADKEYRTQGGIRRIINVWLRYAAGYRLKTISCDLECSQSLVTINKQHLELSYRETYGPSSRLDPFQARRIWEALAGQTIYKEYQALWEKLNHHTANQRPNLSSCSG